MTESELRLRLIELAAALPGVRAGVDHMAQAGRALEVAETWYNGIIGAASPLEKPPVKRDNRKASRS